MRIVFEATKLDKLKLDTLRIRPTPEVQVGRGPLSWKFSYLSIKGRDKIYDFVVMKLSGQKI